METEGGQRTKLWEMDAVSHADEWHVQETNLISTSSRMKVTIALCMNTIQLLYNTYEDSRPLIGHYCSHEIGYRLLGNTARNIDQV